MKQPKLGETFLMPIKDPHEEYIIGFETLTIEQVFTDDMQKDEFGVPVFQVIAYEDDAVIS